MINYFISNISACRTNRDLWHFITGNFVLRHQDLIAQELKRNKAKLIKNVAVYQTQSAAAADDLKTKLKLSGLQLDFIQKLSKFLGVSGLQSHDIYCAFLLRDYRGSRKDLQVGECMSTSHRW
ncbi:hypothetical protein NP493_83g05021 [Ridgeia piscesae]|uniref:Uncharacterized protein n=1 Tax=Ridgeia piscesae TaxID=27915 RepID=A0AAD9UIA5_RIDPI|nr:hypothetical protein NP493_83g05021 [Ridgeia piscesae]